MYKRKSKSVAKAAPSLKRRGSASDEESVENIRKALLTPLSPLRERSNLSGQANKSIANSPKAKKAKSQILKPFATKYFEEITEQSGLTLGNETQNHSLKYEPLMFLRNLKTTLKSNVDFPRNVAEYVKGFKSCSKDSASFNLFLIKNVSYTSEDSSNNRVIRDSVLKLLLSVSCLQEALIDYALERATEYAIEDKGAQVQTLLNHFMFLDDVVAETKLLDGLKELLDVAGHSVRVGVICCIPDIVRHMQHDSLALELSKYLTEDLNLLPAVLDCLSYLSLPRELKVQVHHQMLELLRTDAPYNCFPNLVNFFLSGNNANNDADIIRGLRDGLDWTKVHTSRNVDVASSQIMTILCLSNAVTNSKPLAMEWIKVINQVKVLDDHKPLDIIMLLVLYSTSSTRESIVEGIFCKRIKAELFTCDLINSTFKEFLPVLREYLKQNLKIAKTLLKSKADPSIVEFASNWYLMLFKEMKDSRKAIISELLASDNSDNNDTVVSSLNILTKIAADDMESLKSHSLQIYALVDTLNILTRDGIHHMMDLLCGLAYGIDNSYFQSEVDMLINKQLGNSDPDIKIRGIIGGIMAVKHLVCSEKERDSEESEDSFTDISSLPEGPPKEAALLTNLIFKGTSKDPEMICLFYDEFAQVLSRSLYIEVTFLSWLSSAVTKNLTDIFIIDIDDSLPKRVNGVPISVQYCLNTSHEADEEIALNVVSLCLEESKEGSDLRILPSLLLLTQVIYTKQHQGDLSSIDALLGCGVLMPKVDTDIGLDDFDPESACKVMDCFVYCINWFRELINAFSIHEQTYLRTKVIQRLNALVCLENNFTRFMKNVYSSYKLPVCSFKGSDDNKKKAPVIIQEKVKKVSKKGKKQKKNTDNVENDNSILPATLETQAHPVETSTQVPTSELKCKLNSNLFRILDLEVLSLFQEDLVIENDVPVDCLTVPDSSFRPHNIILILKEITPKLSAVLPSKTKKKGFFGRPAPQKQTYRKAEDVIDSCVKILPRICYFMESIAESIQKSLDANDGVRDSIGMFSQPNVEAQQCLSSLLDTLSVIFSWTGFQSRQNEEILKGALQVLASRRNQKNTQNKSSLKELVTECCAYILKYKEWCLLITTAVSLVNFFKVLSKIYDDKFTTKKLVLLSLEMLSQSWRDSTGEPEKGLVYNQNLDILFSCYFTKPDVEMIKSLSMELKEKVPLLSEKNHVLGTFQCISKTNFPLLFRATYNALYDATKLEVQSGLTDKQHLDLWKNVVMSMKDFVDILKLQENRNNLLTFLKKSIPLLRFFLSNGMPMMELKLKSEHDSVVEILRLLQHSTRFLHSLHCHSRIKKDAAFLSYLPHIKLILETLIYRVKSTLTANNCSNTFWMGNLKNKNLHGELIASQSSTQTEDSGDNDQLPEDDESISSDLEENLTDAGSKSVSNMY